MVKVSRELQSLNIKKNELPQYLVRNITEALDRTISSVNALRYHCIHNPDLVLSKALEDLLESHWERLVSQILNFQTQVNKISMEIENDNNDQTSLSSEEIAQGVCTLPRVDSCNIDLLPPPNLENDEPSGLEYIESKIISCSQPDPSLQSQDTANPDETKTDDGTDKHIKVFTLMFQNFVKTEKIYQSVLYCLNMFYQAISAVVANDKDRSLYEDSKKLFGQVPELLEFHTKWLEILEYSDDSQEIDVLNSFFMALKSHLMAYKEHSVASEFSTEILQKIATHKELVKRVPKVIETPNVKITFEEALKRPSMRIAEYLTIIGDIIDNVSADHQYSKNLIELKEELLIFFEVIRLYSKAKTSSTRHVVKWEPVVEDFGSETRKHRVIILFTDYLICTGENTKNNSHKWYCSLKKIKLNEDITDPKLRGPEFIPVPKVYIDQLKEDIRKIQEEIAISDHRKNPRKLEKLKSQYDQLMGELVLKVPSYPLYLHLADGKRILLLFMNATLRDSWERIIRIRKNSDLIDYRPIYIGEVSECIETITKKIQESLKVDTSIAVKTQKSLNTDSSASIARFTGNLFVKGFIRRYKSSTSSPHAYTGEMLLNIEMDKHIKGYKPNSKNSKFGLATSEMFHLELENSPGYLYVTSARCKNRPVDNVGTFVIYLATVNINDVPYVRQKKAFIWGEVLIFLEFHQANECKYISKFNPYQPSLQAIIDSELTNLPTVVNYSIQIIESKGMDEPGIYRISATASQVLLCRQLWMEGFIMSLDDLNEFDIHVIAGNFKQFLRELEEPVIPHDALEKMGRFDYENGTFEEFYDILMKMPEINRNVFIMIMNHLVDIPNHPTNKMTFKSVTTVFGVNLMRFISSETSQLDTAAPLAAFVKILEFWQKYALGHELGKISLK